MDHLVTWIPLRTGPDLRKRELAAEERPKRKQDMATPGAIGSPWRRNNALLDSLSSLRRVFQEQSVQRPDKQLFPLMPKNRHRSMWKKVENLPNREAAILVPLASYGGSPALLFTKRSSNLSTHASEVSFPGGHFDNHFDKSLEDTAIRETKEELNNDMFPWEDLEIVGRASKIPSIKGTPVTPFLAVLPYEISQDTFAGNPDEVDEIFCVSLEELVRVETSQYSERFRTHIPVYETDAGHRIWGLTAVVTRPLLHGVLRPVFLGK